jgi:LmbE family N-acetylglucosaminyl deacetylase
MKVLVLSPHTDDAELGAGGTISRLKEEGNEVSYLAFSSADESNGDYDLRAECRAAVNELIGCKPMILDYPVRRFPEHRQGILQFLIDNFSDLPNLVLTPSSDSQHQDHQVVTQEAVRAFRRVCSIWGYELPWQSMNFNEDLYMRLTQHHVDMKIKAIKHYVSQNKKSHVFNDDFITGLARVRGATIKYPYAECFEVLREIV